MKEKIISKVYISKEAKNISIMKTNYNHMSEDEKILNILDLMGAVSPETAVTTEQMIDKAIEEGTTKDIFTDGWHGHKEGDHPWWLLLAAMSGTGSEEEVAKHNVPYLHRHRVRREKNGRKTNVMVYWYDESYAHEITYTGKVYREKIQKQQEIRDLLQRTKNLPKNVDEAKARMSNNPDFINIDGKFIRKEWIQNNPEKAKISDSIYVIYNEGTQVSGEKDNISPLTGYGVWDVYYDYVNVRDVLPLMSDATEELLFGGTI